MGAKKSRVVILCELQRVFDCSLRMQTTNKAQEQSNHPLPQHVILHDTRTGQTVIPQVHFVFDSEPFPQGLTDESTIIVDLQSNGSIKEARTLSDNIQISSVHEECASNNEKTIHISGMFPLPMYVDKSGSLFSNFLINQLFIEKLLCIFTMTFNEHDTQISSFTSTCDF